MRESGFSVEKTSFLYETSPNPSAKEELAESEHLISRYLNAAVKCVVPNSMGPEECLNALQSIETKLGRQRKFKNASRTIDLDILFFNNDVINSERLQIPHPLMHCRSFVMIPLVDLFDCQSSLSAAEYIFHPKIGVSLGHLYRNSFKIDCNSYVDRVIPLCANKLIKYRYTEVSSGSRLTLLCGIVNVTPDSFSDGGKFFATEAAASHALNLAISGADWIDVGGQSTKPGAEQCSVEEEVDRIVRSISSIKATLSSSNFSHIPISVDTYRSSVADAALTCGANIINDISGDVRDPRILSIAKKYNCPIVLAHSTNETCGKTENILNIVQNALYLRVSEAIKAGIFRWIIILDPGIGFSKNIVQNIPLLNDLINRSDYGEILKCYPSLVGYSRKSFIGQIIGKPHPEERVIGDVSLGTILMDKNVFAIRVHDVDAHNQARKIVNCLKANNDFNLLFTFIRRVELK